MWKTWLRVFACLTLTTSVAAQQGYTLLPNERGQWRPWRFAVRATGARDRAATSQELTAFEARLLELRRVISSAPTVAEPAGFDVALDGSLADSSPRTGQSARDLPRALAARLHFGAFPHLAFVRNGKTERAVAGETALLYFDVNELPSGRSDTVPSDWSGVATDLFLEPPHSEDFAGLPRAGDMLIVKRKPASLWVQASRAQVIDLFIQQRKKAVAGFDKEAAYRKDSPAGNRGWAAAMVQLAEAEEDFAALSATEKLAPACYRQNVIDTRPRARVSIAGEDRCRAVVQPNRDYFDPRLPRTALQVITVVGLKRCTDPPDPRTLTPLGCDTNLALIRSLDWTKVKALMDR
jgi:hypothetical protein